MGFRFRKVFRLWSNAEHLDRQRDLVGVSDLGGADMAFQPTAGTTLQYESPAPAFTTLNNSMAPVRLRKENLMDLLLY